MNRTKWEWGITVVQLAVIYSLVWYSLVDNTTIACGSSVLWLTSIFLDGQASIQQVTTAVEVIASSFHEWNEKGRNELILHWYTYKTLPSVTSSVGWKNMTWNRTKLRWKIFAFHRLKKDQPYEVEKRCLRKHSMGGGESTVLQPFRFRPSPRLYPFRL